MCGILRFNIGASGEVMTGRTSCIAAIAMVFSLCWPIAGSSQGVKPELRFKPVASQLVLQNARSTNFDPKVNGLAFENGFTNSFIPEFDIRTAGLCGGMVYTALDFYNAAKPVPNWPVMPSENDPFRQYIYDRQISSILNNTDKWTELTINPFGSRNDEFFNWGLQAGPGGRMTELKRFIDAGKPVPLGLRSCGDSCKGDHQVLAIGYDFGRYKGDLGANQTDMKIRIYDPNYPGRTMTLIADPVRKRYFLEEEADSPEHPRRGWLSWFVDTKYVAHKPPNIGPDSYPDDGKVHDLAIGIQTGNDDLRGGHNNLNLVIDFYNAPTQAIHNANQSKRWVSGGAQWVRVPLTNPVEAQQIKDIRLSLTNYGGDATADNWDIRRLHIRGIGHGINQQLYYAPKNDRAIGLVRLTKSSPDFTAVINRYPPAPPGAATTPALNEPSTLERNTDRPGRYYYHRYYAASINFRACQRLCAQDAKCKSYTFRAASNGQNSCALKENIYPKQTSAGVISGIKFKYLGQDH